MYTPEFISITKEKEKKYNDSIQSMIKDIEGVQQEEPAFADHWGRDFMIINLLSIRQI